MQIASVVRQKRQGKRKIAFVISKLALVQQIKVDLIMMLLCFEVHDDMTTS